MSPGTQGPPVTLTLLFKILIHTTHVTDQFGHYQLLFSGNTT